MTVLMCHEAASLTFAVVAVLRQSAEQRLRELEAADVSSVARLVRPVSVFDAVPGSGLKCADKTI